jgi:hypothetical protein
MTSLRQIEANRHNNALKSTGPKTEQGKRRSRKNALRHGLTAETVIEPLENPQEYRAFEDAIVAEYQPQTPVEQEFVHRLASLFWRLRRATSIETGLLRMQSEILHAFRSSRQNAATLSTAEGASRALAGSGAEIRQDIVRQANGEQELQAQGDRANVASASRDIAISFLRLANLDNDIVDRLSRYEAALWRQLAQALFTLQALKRR